MSQDNAGTLNVTIALVGTDQFDSAVDEVNQKLQSVSQNAGSAIGSSGSSGISGLGSAANNSGSSVSSLGSKAGDLSTTVSALSGSLSGTVGGIINMQGSLDGLTDKADANQKAHTALEKATNTYESTLAKYGGTADKASKATKDLSSETDKLSSANDKVQKDQDAISRTQEALNKLRSEGKQNTTEYSDKLRTLSEQTNQLKEDQGKAKDAQDSLNQSHQDFNTQAAPAADLGAQKIKAAYDRMIDAQNTVAKTQRAVNEEWLRFGMSTAQTVLGGIGSVSGAIGTFAKLLGGDDSNSAKGAMKAVESEATKVAGALGGIGNPVPAGVGKTAKAISSEDESSIKGALKDVEKEAPNVGNALTNLSPNQGVKTLAKDIGDDSAKTSIKGAVKDVETEVKNNMPTAFNALSNLQGPKDLTKQIGGAEGDTSSIKGAVKDVETEVKNNVPTAFNALSNLQGPKDLSKAIAGTEKDASSVKGALGAVEDEVGKVPGKFGILSNIPGISQLISKLAGGGGAAGAAAEGESVVGAMGAAEAAAPEMAAGIGSSLLPMVAVGGPIALVAAAALAIGTNFGGSRDIIVKAMSDIAASFQQSGVMDDIKKLQDALGNFLKDPFGTTSSLVDPKTGQAAKTVQGALYNPISQGSPWAIGGPTALTPGGPAVQNPIMGQIAQIGSTESDTSNAQILGQSILNVIEAGFNWAIGQLPTVAKGLGDALNSALKAAMPSLDAVGSAILKGVDNVLSGKDVGAGQQGNAAVQELGKIGDSLSQVNDQANKSIDEAIATFLNPDNTPKTHDEATALGQKIAGWIHDAITGGTSQLTAKPGSGQWSFLGGGGPSGQTGFGFTQADINSLFEPLFDAKNWKTLFKNAQDTLSKAFHITQIYDAFKGLFDPANWTNLFRDATAVLTKAFHITQIYDTFKPLFDPANWTNLFKDAAAVLSKAFHITQIYDTFKSLFDPANWTNLFRDAQTVLVKALTPTQIYDTLKPLFDISNWTNLIKDGETAVEKALTPTQIYDTLKPLFDVNNWTNLIRDAGAALIKALTLSALQVEQVFAPLWDPTAWQTIGQKIGAALTTALQTAVNAVINSLNAAKNAIPGGSAIPNIPTIGSQGQQQSFSPTSNNGQNLTNPSTGLPFRGATLSNQPIVINMQVNGRTLAQVMAQFQTGTSQFS